MAYNNSQELLQPRAAILNDVVVEAIGKDLARQRRNCDTGAFPFEDIAEILEIRVPSPYGTLAQLEGGDVGTAEDLVVGIHVPAHTVRLWISDLDDRANRKGPRFSKSVFSPSYNDVCFYVSFFTLPVLAHVS